MSRSLLEKSPTSTRRGLPAYVGIVIPAHNEEQRITASVAAARRAIAHPLLARIPIELAIVVDCCSDTTADRASAAIADRGQVIEVAHRHVGAARAAGFDDLIERSSGLELDRVWLATTDADTLVGADWLVRQIRWWQQGADAVAGTVRPATWSEQSPKVRRRFEGHMARLGTGHDHPHVHGANLGFTRAAYAVAGAMPPLASGEDHAWWNSAKMSGARVIHIGDNPVLTSTRREGRAPDGFADLLRHLGPNETRS